LQREWAAKNPRATFKAPITVEEVLNSRMIAYAFCKWPAGQAACSCAISTEQLPYSRGIHNP
jgi:acetyl-CoA acetyltransferase